MYRLIQEALTNCQRHAAAKRVEVALERRAGQGADEVVLCVADDGRGMPPQAQRSGFGVSGMEERVAMLGGRFSIASEPGRGVRLTACLPLVGRAA